VDVPQAELEVIRGVIDESAATGANAERVMRGQRDAIVVYARTHPRYHATAWAMKRIPGLYDPVVRHRRLLLATLVTAALLCLLATLAAAFNLARGVASIKRGLRALEKDFLHRLPESNDELGEISRAVNRMAELRLALEMQLRREDRLRAMGRLLAAIAHEIRNPLNGIRLSAQYLERRPDPRQIAMIIEEVDRLDKLLQGLLVFGKSTPPVVSAQALAPAIERSVRAIQPEAERRRIVLNVSMPELTARFDGDQLHQVLLNLLLNSMESLGQGGSVSIHGQDGGGEVRILIADSGPPLGADQQEHLFEAFHSTRAGGTGLGLAVSRELIENMGGRLVYDGTKPNTTFVITLPAEPHA
jgi:signal transduction histidine kinase